MVMNSTSATDTSIQAVSPESSLGASAAADCAKACSGSKNGKPSRARRRNIA